jgi:adenosylcobyric acid synthase
VESPVPSVAGLGWLPLCTRFDVDKTTRLRSGTGPDGSAVRGYEIRHGRTAPLAGWQEWITLDDVNPPVNPPVIPPGEDDVESACDPSALLYGTSLHGLFESDRFRGDFLRLVATVRGKSWQPSGASFAAAREYQIDRVADVCAAYLDMDALWRLVECGA